MSVRSASSRSLSGYPPAIPRADSVRSFASADNRGTGARGGLGHSIWVKDSLADGRVEAPGACRWSKHTIDEQADIVAQIGKAVLSGEWPSNLTWHKFTTATERARVRPKVSPGPGAYELPSSFGPQPDAHHRSGPVISLPRGKAKEVFHAPRRAGNSDGSHRVRVLPRKLEGAPRLPPAVESGEVEPNVIGEVLFNSKYTTVPAATLKPKWREPNGNHDLGSDNPPVSSSLGRQPTSGHPTAPAIAFPRLARLSSPERTFAPNPFSYHPKHEYLLPQAPVTVFSTTSIAADPDKEAQAIMQAPDLSAGKYDTSLPLGARPGIVGHTVAFPPKFGPADEYPTLEVDKLILAHDRRQPQALREPKLKPRDRFADPVSVLKKT